MKVLVADDEAIARKMIVGTLERAGYEVTAVADGQQALNALRSEDFQLVVSDWDMPNLNGLELCRAIRGGEFTRYIYVLMVTGNSRPQDVVEGLNAGADDFVSKPFNPAEVIVRLRTGERILTLESAEMTIFAMARLAESRDTDTGAHLERVRSYCRVLAEQMRQTDKYRDLIDEDYCRLIYQTSPLHDIGKVAIPDCVLLKPGRLTDDEFDMMKTHAVEGAATLAAAMVKYPNARFLRMAHDIALSHHEKYDGSGYPHGLAGTNIPLCGRIVALADVFDALTSRRVYKKAYAHAVARNIIVEDRGKHFDPDVVDAFLAKENEFIDICERYAEFSSVAA